GTAGGGRGRGGGGGWGGGGGPRRREGAHGGGWRSTPERAHHPPEQRPRAGPAGDDREFAPAPGSQLAGGFRHADHWNLRNFAQGKQSRIAEAGKQDHVQLVTVPGKGVERRVCGDRGRGARADIAGAEL